MNSLLLVITSDSECRLQMEAIAAEELIECYFASHGDHLSDLAKRLNPFMLFVDFTSEEPDWILKHLSEIKAKHHNFPIVGMVSGDEEADQVRLQKAGCEQVLTKDVFTSKIRSLILRYLR